MTVSILLSGTTAGRLFKYNHDHLHDPWSLY
jgi:hypothetical protein